MFRTPIRFLFIGLLPVLIGCDNDSRRVNESDNARLSGLTLSVGTLTPGFSAATVTYTAEVDATVASVTVSAQPEHAAATVDVAGSGAPSANVTLADGPNEISIRVTAQDGTIVLYRVTVTRLAAAISNDADLADLSSSAGELVPAFQPAVEAYTVATGFAAVSTTVTATASDSGAALTVNGQPADSGTPSAPIPLAEGVNVIEVVVTAADGTTTRTYTIEVTRQSADAFAQEAYIKSSSQNDFFGQEVALSGDTLAVGVKWEDSDASGVAGTNTDPFNENAPNAGAVYVFVRDASGWQQQAYIKASNSDAFDFFGAAIALDGDTLAVGAYGEDGGSVGVGGDELDNSADLAGAVYVFVRSAGVWTQEAYLKASNTGPDDQFGTSVALSGNTLVVGAINEDGASTGVGGDPTSNAAENAGAAYVFTRDAGVWSQQAYLKASNAEAGDLFGRSVAIDGDTLAVSAEREMSAAQGIDGDQTDNTRPGAGAVYVFTRDGVGAWSQQAYVKASNTQSGDQFGGDIFGDALALSGDTLAVGARGEDSAATGANGDQSDNTVRDSGAVYVFTVTAGVWSQQAYLKPSDPGEDAWFGSAIDLKGDSLVVGARLAANGGAAYLFQRAAGQWAQTARLRGSNTEGFDMFGIGVAVAGGLVAVGAEQEQSSATGIGGDDSDNSAVASGAVYVFR